MPQQLCIYLDAMFDVITNKFKRERRTDYSTYYENLEIVLRGWKNNDSTVPLFALIVILFIFVTK